MGRRKSGSAAGMGLLLVLGAIYAVLTAAYRFVVENLAAVVAVCTVSGLVLLLGYLSAKAKKRDEIAPSRSGVQPTPPPLVGPRTGAPGAERAGLSQGTGCGAGEVCAAGGVGHGPGCHHRGRSLLSR